MMIIYAKIGTGSQSKIRVGWKRNPLKVGDKIKFRSYPRQPGEKWKAGIVSDIRNLGYLLHFISFFIT